MQMMFRLGETIYIRILHCANDTAPYNELYSRLKNENQCIATECMLVKYTGTVLCTMYICTQCTVAQARAHIMGPQPSV